MAASSFVEATCNGVRSYLSGIRGSTPACRRSSTKINELVYG